MSSVAIGTSDDPAEVSCEVLAGEVPTRCKLKLKVL